MRLFFIKNKNKSEIFIPCSLSVHGLRCSCHGNAGALLQPALLLLWRRIPGSSLGLKKKLKKTVTFLSFTPFPQQPLVTLFLVSSASPAVPAEAQREGQAGTMARRHRRGHAMHQVIRCPSFSFFETKRGGEFTSCLRLFLVFLS